jgi:hypothetical protein
MTTKKKATKRPVPDVKAATAEILTKMADWLESPEGLAKMPVGKLSKEEAAAFEEARRLAVNYIRLGATS